MKKLSLLSILLTITLQTALAGSVSDHRVYAVSFDGDSCRAAVSGYHWARAQEDMLKSAFIVNGNGKTCQNLKVRMNRFNSMATTEGGLQFVKNNQLFGPILGIATQDVSGIKIMTEVTDESGEE